MGDKTNSQESDRASTHTTGMACTACAATIGKGLAQTPRVEQADVDFASGKVLTKYHPTKVDLAMKNRRNRNPEAERGAVREFGQAVRTSLLIRPGPAKLQQSGDPIDLGSLPLSRSGPFSSPVALALPAPMTKGDRVLWPPSDLFGFCL